ncbi:MAG: rubrerythrin [Clostridia bacterium]
MENLKGSKTEKNLFAAFAGETQARVKYSIFAKKAKEEGYDEISEIFNLISNNEYAHGEMWFKFICNGIGDTLSNLKSAMSGEKYEWEEMYPEFAKTAKEEGFDEIATLFEKVADIESLHHKRFASLADNLENGTTFSKSADVIWECENCGHIQQGKNAPSFCPVCGYPQSSFKEKVQ